MIGKRVDLRKLYSMEAAEGIGKEGVSDEGILIGGSRKSLEEGGSDESEFNGSCRECLGRGWIWRRCTQWKLHVVLGKRVDLTRFFFQLTLPSVLRKRVDLTRVH